VKVRGRRAYDLARRGLLAELPPRTVVVHELSLVCYDYPELVLEVRCGKGTYIRALGRDVAEAAGSCALMSSLRRLAIGPFTVQAACSLEHIRTRDDIMGHLLPFAAALNQLPRVTLTQAEAFEVAHGRTIPNRCGDRLAEIAAWGEDGRLLAILVPRAGARLGPVKNFRAPGEAPPTRRSG
jgi:tRNA pseudouridine55 synthase